MRKHDFASMIDRSGGEDACWPWKGYTLPNGYGQTRHAGKKVLTHRLVFFLEHGRWPEPCCLHRCDNPPCCNPMHLFEGTQTDNMNDMTIKGRRAKVRGMIGVGNPAAKLSENDVRDIRANHALCRVTQTELARRFGVSIVMIGNIVHGRSWKTLPLAGG